MTTGDFVGPLEEKPKFSFEEIIFRFRYPLLFILIGLILLGMGVYWIRGGYGGGEKVEVLESVTEVQGSEITVEAAGAVQNPGVYKLQSDDRIEDLLISAGGISSDADRNWMEKYLNRAAKLTDGQKVYIPKTGEQSQVLSANNSGGDQSVSSDILLSGESPININTSDQKTLETLSGIGPTYAKKIIEQRPYSTVDELLTKDVIPQKTFEKIKNQITVY